MAICKEKDSCQKLFKTCNINDCYDTLNKIVINSRRSGKYKSAKGIKTKKAFILGITMEHINFLENTLKQVLEKDQNLTSTFEGYQRKFAAEIQTEYSKKDQYKINGKVKIEINKPSCSMVNDGISESHNTCSKTSKNENVNGVKSSINHLSQSSELFTPKSELYDDFLKSSLNTEECKMQANITVKPKCSRNLENSYPSQEVNDVKTFDGFYKFYETIIELLQKIIPFSVITSECSRNFIINIWSELPEEHQTKFMTLATESRNKNGILQDLSQKQNSLPLFSENELLLDEAGSWDLPDFPNITDIYTDDFDFDDLKPTC